MNVQELKNEAYKLSVSDRLILIEGIVRSLSRELRPRPNRKGIAQRMRGLAKTDGPPPTDAEVEAMLEECLVEKYLK
ncbi:MAG: hypothetical protein F6J93_33455 [Oscillatoria sp. SIO1A7]|nr:hypothetical protein [Oscillatoria sp. SIO1A7]